MSKNATESLLNGRQSLQSQIDMLSLLENIKIKDKTYTPE